MVTIPVSYTHLGVSGSGKSMAMKSTIANIALATNDDIIIIDAEREYGPLTRALGGEVIEISPHSPHHINPLDIADGYGCLLYTSRCV